jgi:rhodanese-related sulfurtransferase
MYWTLRIGLRTVRSMIKLPALLFSLVLMAHVPVQAGQALAVSADDAQLALSQGAFVMDVRAADQFAAGHLPQSAAVSAHAATLPLQELAALLGKAGIDSSRTMLIVGDSGDARAQALWKRLAQVTSGRVLWLVGGVQEWQMRGYALTTAVSLRHSVPQFLVNFDAPAKAWGMAGGRIRSSAMLERDLPIQLALQ